MIKPRRMKWVGHVAHMGEMVSAYNILANKPKGKRPLGSCRHRWEDIRMHLREIEWQGVTVSF
jgi:hypothetical protein